jgi:hypothetical protein
MCVLMTMTTGIVRCSALLDMDIGQGHHPKAMAIHQLCTVPCRTHH